MEHYRRIRQYILSRGITLRFVASQSGIQVKRFYRIMDGTSQMTVQEYERICRRGLQLEPSFFLTMQANTAADELLNEDGAV